MRRWTRVVAMAPAARAVRVTAANVFVEGRITEIAAE
jgi:hypothetical protein